jgi:hypothetical protein
MMHMTSPPRPCDDELNVNQLGLVARAVDVHRQAQVRKLNRTSNPAERATILAEIGDLEHAGSLFKRRELERLIDNE